MAATDDRHTAVEGYVASVTGRTLSLWSKVNPYGIRRSWYELSLDAFAYISIGQMAAAAGAEPYVSTVVPTAISLGSVQPRAFAGVASDGRNLMSLLQQPAIKALTAISGGATSQRALEMGGHSLAMISASMITDAARAAEHTAIAARPAVKGYVRTLHPPSCARCAIIAGTWYRWNEGFQRHPRCDCTHEPALQTIERPTAPKEYFDSLSRDLQDRYFGIDTAEKIRNGEVDMIKYVSEKVRVRKTLGRATDGAPPIGKPFTIIDHEAHAQMLDAYRRAAAAATGGDAALARELRDEARSLATRAYAERAARPRARVMPEQLTDGATRAEAIAGLTQYGYLT